MLGICVVVVASWFRFSGHGLVVTERKWDNKRRRLCRTRSTGEGVVREAAPGIIEYNWLSNPEIDGTHHQVKLIIRLGRLACTWSVL